MGHNIHAVVGPCVVLRELARVTEAHLSVPLPQGFCAVPMSEALLDHLGGVYPSVAGRRGDSRFVHLGGGLIELLETLSRRAPVAYIETDYFGGVGTQSAAAYIDGEVAYADSTAGRGPISIALRLIGVDKDTASDEFDALGLGRLRRMDAFEPS